MITFKRLCLVLAAIGLLAGVSSASIIYYDDFSGDGTSTLSGTAPDVTTDGATWAGYASGTQWMDNGTIVSNAASTRRNMFLPFTPESGKVYTAKLDVVRLATMSDRLDFGFVTSAVYDGGFPLAASGVGASPWMTSYAINGKVDSYTGPANNNPGGQVSVADPDTFNTLEMVLDTTDALWTVDFILNGATIRSETFSSNPDIHYIGFSRYATGTFQVDNFELSVIPEPATLGLVVISGVFLTVVRKCTASLL